MNSSKPVSIYLCKSSKIPFESFLNKDVLDEESDEEDEDDEDDLPRAGVACSAARSLLTVNIGHMVTSVDWSQQWDHTTVVQPYTGPVPTAAPCQCSCQYTVQCICDGYMHASYKL